MEKIRKAMKLTKTELREIIREEISKLNEGGRKSKDAVGLRYALAVDNNVTTIEELVNSNKDVKEVVSTFANPLINSIKATLNHSYKPHPTPMYNTTSDLKRYGNISNQERIDKFKKYLEVLLRTAEELVKKPTKVGVKRLGDAHHNWWNNGGIHAVRNGFNNRTFIA